MGKPIQGEKGHSLTRATFPTFPYKTWRAVYMRNNQMARLEARRMTRPVRSPLFENRVTFLAGTTFLHIKASKQVNQSRRERYPQLST